MQKLRLALHSWLPWTLNLLPSAHRNHQDPGHILVVPHFLHFRMMEVAEILGTFRAAEMFLCSSPDLNPNTVP